MALINRITRLFRADIHAVLDRLEEPESLLKEAIREMELSIDNDMGQLETLEREHTENNERLHATEQSLLKIEEELNLCFESQNDVLARKLVKRKLETLRFSQISLQRHKQLEHATENIRSTIAKNNDALSLIKQKLEIYTHHTNNTNSQHYHPDNDLFINDDEVEIAFIKEKQQRASS